LRVRASLYNKETGEVKEQDIFMGDFPLMTDSGTFIINGAERVIVSQLVRSPGVYYSLSRDKAGKELFAATVIPNRGAWLEYETDSNDIFYVRIDKNRKLPVTTFVRALGLGSNAQIEDFFGEDILIRTTLDKDSTKNVEEALLEVYRKLRPGEPPTVDSAQTHIDNLFFDPRRYDLSRVGRYKYNKKLALAARISGQTLAQPVIDPLTGELIAEAGEILSRDKARQIEKSGADSVFLSIRDLEVKVVSNGMVDASDFLGFDVLPFGINEKVRFSVLREILELEGDEARQKALRERADELIPKHIIKDDIFASINYMCNLGRGLCQGCTYS
jgi:DNA-directed RNA polymerase subunit beta